MKFLQLFFSAGFAVFVTVGGLCRAADILPVAGTLVSYSVESGSEFSASEVAPNLVATTLGLGSSYADLEAGVSIPGSVFLNPTMDSPTPAASRTNAQYFEFTLSSASFYLFTPEGLSFSVGNGGAGGARGWSVYSSADGFTAPLATAGIVATNPSLEEVSVPLSGFAPSADPLTFRFYVYSPAAGQGVFFDDISLTGVVTVPEPSFLVMAGFLSGSLMLRRRRGFV